MKTCSCDTWKKKTIFDHDEAITLVHWNFNKATFIYCPWCGKKLEEIK